MKQNHSRRNRTIRTKTRANRRQTKPDRAAKGAANLNIAGETVPVSEAARMLHADDRTVRRWCDSGRLPSFLTPGNHRRIFLASIEAIRDGNADVKRPVVVHLPSPAAQLKKERIEELNLTIQEKKSRMALQELEDEECRRVQQEEAAHRAQGQEAKRIRLDREIERTRREREREQARTEARAAEARHEWEAQRIRDMLRELPRDVPPELRLEVTEVIRPELPDLYQTYADHAEDIVEATLRAAVEKTLRPWRRNKEAEKAAEEALNQLPLYAKASWGEVSEWELRAKAEALATIAALPETATFQQMIAAARAVGKRVAEEYEHNEAQARAGREAEQAKATLEAVADTHLCRVISYLLELQADPNGWDFEGKLYEYARQIKQEIKPGLIEALPLDFTSGRQRVEQLVDAWLANACNSQDSSVP
jgi:excisionase family DNA binding protein